MPLLRRFFFCQKAGSSQLLVKNRMNVFCYPGRRAGFFKNSGAGFAYENRKQWVCGELYANRGVCRAGFFKNPGPRFALGNGILIPHFVPQFLRDKYWM